MERPSSPVFPANDPTINAELREIQSRKSAMPTWRGKTPTGKLLPGGRKRKTKKVKRSKRKSTRRAI